MSFLPYTHVLFHMGFISSLLMSENLHKLAFLFFQLFDFVNTIFSKTKPEISKFMKVNVMRKNHLFYNYRIYCYFTQLQLLSKAPIFRNIMVFLLEHMGVFHCMINGFKSTLIHPKCNLLVWGLLAEYEKWSVHLVLVDNKVTFADKVVNNQ